MEYGSTSYTCIGMAREKIAALNVYKTIRSKLCPRCSHGDSSVLLQVRCHCTSGVGWCVWKDVEWAVYIESTYSVYGCL